MESSNESLMLCITNFPEFYTSENIHEILSYYGELKYFSLKVDPNDPLKCTAVAEYFDKVHAYVAIKDLNGMKIWGTTLFATFLNPNSINNALNPELCHLHGNATEVLCLIGVVSEKILRDPSAYQSKYYFLS